MRHCHRFPLFCSVAGRAARKRGRGCRGDTPAWPDTWAPPPPPPAGAADCPPVPCEGAEEKKSRFKILDFVTFG